MRGHTTVKVYRTLNINLVFSSSLVMWKEFIVDSGGGVFWTILGQLGVMINHGDFKVGCLLECWENGFTF